MPLTSEQQAALDELMAHVPRPAPNALQTWLGFSADELRTKLTGLLAHKDRLQNVLLDQVRRNPLDAAFEFLALASLAFFWAEKDINPRVKTYVDAFYYIGTCASVGYADIFAVTQTGKAIAGLVMIVGPALAAKTLERPAPTAPPS